MMSVGNSSPFGKTKFYDIAVAQEFQYEATVPALRFPDGKIVINLDPNTKHALLLDYARIMGAEVVSVKGVWNFIPAVENKEEKDS
jgi:hypothetical protein